MYAWTLRGLDARGHTIVLRHFASARACERAAEELYECGHVWDVAVTRELWNGRGE